MVSRSYIRKPTLSLFTIKSFIVRDEWDSKKPDYEKQLSDILGTVWTIDINPNAIWLYYYDGYAKDSLGSCIKRYFIYFAAYFPYINAN